MIADLEADEIEKLRTINKDDLEKVANAQGQLGIPVVLKFPDERFGILTPGGLYENQGSRFFPSLEKIHKILKEFGFKRFIQDGWLKEFS